MTLVIIEASGLSTDLSDLRGDGCCDRYSGGRHEEQALRNVVTFDLSVHARASSALDWFTS
jgi:hypothetical protein